MNDTLRLTFIGKKSENDLIELWINCFNTQEKLAHINSYVPYPITLETQLNPFLINTMGYESWLIKRKGVRKINTPNGLRLYC